MLGPLDQQIPHPQNRQTGLDERQQFLIKDQELLEGHLAPTPKQPTLSCQPPSSALEPEHQVPLTFQSSPGHPFIVPLYLTFDRGPIRSRDSVQKDRHRALLDITPLPDRQAGSWSVSLSPIRHSPTLRHLKGEAGATPARRECDQSLIC